MTTLRGDKRQTSGVTVDTEGILAAQLASGVLNGQNGTLGAMITSAEAIFDARMLGSNGYSPVWIAATSGNTMQGPQVVSTSCCKADAVLLALMAPEVELPHWKNRIFEQIEDFRSLPLDWNGQGSEPPNEVAATLARNALTASDTVGLIPHRVVPSPDGGVALCFRRGDGRFASLECLNAGDVIALQSDRTGNPRAWEVAPNPEALRKAVELIREYIAS